MLIFNRYFLSALGLLLCLSSVHAAAPSLKDIEQKALAGDASAAVTAGLAFVNGAGVPKNESRALSLFRMAAAQGDARGQYNLCAIYSSSAVFKDPDLALKNCKLAAEQNYPAAEYALSKIYETGQGVAVDKQRAIKYLKDAADHGMVTAQYEMGVYLSRTTVKGKFDNAGIEKYLLGAARGGHVLAMRRLADFYLIQSDNAAIEAQNLLNSDGAVEPPEMVEVVIDRTAQKNNTRTATPNTKKVTKSEALIGSAIEWFEAAGAKNDQPSLTKLCPIYDDQKTVYYNAAKALDYCERAANLGEVAVMAYIADKYHFGRGVPQNDSIAADWYQRAADNGDLAAMRNLGAMLILGLGRTADVELGVSLITKSAEAGNREAQLELSNLLLEGKRLKLNIPKGVEWLAKSAEQGLSEAQLSLGIRYLNGDGVTQDLNQAVSWFRKASAQGEPNSTKWLREKGYR
ncbi:MAG: tetratricopeptide repeat protein [Candidatus Pacebacteria bacterium]|nr:tetratricopeptide repeat protein [Candidatus Paceibacterota bacterium]